MNVKNLLITVAVSALTSYLAVFCLTDKGAMRAVDGSKVSMMNSPAGRFVFTLISREKTDNGSKFIFTLGNNNAADYQGIGLRLSWGKKPVDAKEKVEMSAQDIMLDHIGAGQWKDFEVLVPETDESKMQTVNLSIITLDKVSFHQGK